MHRLRRLAALLMGVLLLQGSLLGAALACSLVPAGGGGAAAGEVAPPGGDGGHGEHAHHGAGVADAPRPDDGAPAPEHDGQMHCPTAMACTSVGVAGVLVVLPTTALVIADRIAAANSAAPASIVGAPEPPPPRG